MCTLDCVSSAMTNKIMIFSWRRFSDANAFSQANGVQNGVTVPPIASLLCELYVTFSFFSSGCRSPSLPSPMSNDDGTNSLPRHDEHDSFLLFDRTAPGASMTRMTKHESPPSPPYRPRRRTNIEEKSRSSLWVSSAREKENSHYPRLKQNECIRLELAGERR